MERKIGLFSRRARSKAASPQGCQSTGLWACCSRYGLFSCARRLVCSGRTFRFHRTSRERETWPPLMFREHLSDGCVTAGTQAGCRESCYADQATACSPFLATRARSFREAPCGRFSPRSHWLTRPVVTFRYRAKTAWLAPSRNRRARISVGLSGCTGVRHRSSNSRIVRFSKTPAAWRPSAVSWIDAIRGLRYCFSHRM